MNRTCRSEWHGLLPTTSTVSRFLTMWFPFVGVCEGTCVGLPTTATRRPGRLVKKDCCCCWLHRSKYADQRLGGIPLSARCVPCDEWCSHWTFIRYRMKTWYRYNFSLIPCKVCSYVMRVRDIKQRRNPVHYFGTRCVCISYCERCVKLIFIVVIISTWYFKSWTRFENFLLSKSVPCSLCDLFHYL